jgi:hypothetical protein
MNVVEGLEHGLSEGFVPGLIFDDLLISLNFLSAIRVEEFPP